MATTQVAPVVDKRTAEQKAEDLKNQQATANTQTPESKAAEIVNAAVKDKMLVVSGTTFQKLETVVRYLNRDKIQGRSEAWFKKEFESLCTSAVELLISSREEQITKYLAKKEQDEKAEAFRMLISRGLSVPDAYKAIYG